LAHKFFGVSPVCLGSKGNLAKYFRFPG
jgi:hypothetical protein